MFSPPFSGLQDRIKHPLELTKVCPQCYGVYSQPEYCVPLYTTMLWNKGCYYPVEHQWDIQSNQNSVTVVLDESGKHLAQNTASCVGCGYRRVRVCVHGKSYISTRGSHSHRACRTICNRDQNEIKGSTRHFVLNQAIKERFKETIKRLTKEEG